MQIINIEWLPNGDEDPAGCNNLFLVDVPDIDFDRTVREIEREVDELIARAGEHGEIPVAAEICEQALCRCGINALPVSRVGHIKI